LREYTGWDSWLAHLGSVWNAARNHPIEVTRGRSPCDTPLLAATTAVAIEALRRQTLRKFPEDSNAFAA
jgi:hypothetical protein